MPLSAPKFAAALALAALGLASYASAPLAAKPDAGAPQNSELAHRFEAAIKPEELQGWLKILEPRLPDSCPRRPLKLIHELISIHSASANPNGVASVTAPPKRQVA